MTRFRAYVRSRPRASAVGVLVALAVLVSGFVAGCGGTTRASSDLVTRSGQNLVLDGKPFRFVGFNLFDGAASDVYACTPSNRLGDEELTAILKDARDRAGATVIRFWAYQTYTDGGTDFAGMDRLIAAADALGLKVMPVLEDGPGYCSTGQSGVNLDKADNGTYYAQGYKSPYGSARLSLRDYAKVMAAHYKDDTTILGWSILNEAESTQRDASGASVLVGLARDVSAVIHKADPNHLVTMGAQSNGAPGGSGSDFRAIYKLKGIDFAEAHDYAAWGDDANPMPGALAGGALPKAGSAQCKARDAKIACSFAIARALKKPLIIGESGIKASDAQARSVRAQQMRAKVDAAFAAAGSGYLVWHLDIRPSFDGDHYAVLPDQDDPLFPALKQAADAAGAGW